MPSTFHLALIFAIALAPVLSAESRSWKSADGVRSLEGDYVMRTTKSVTIVQNGGKETTIEFTHLHPDDIKWVETNHSLASEAPPQDPNAFFDNLTFRDTRDSTTAKLKASKIVESTVDETFFGRSGLNGVFRTRQKIGNLDCFLFFDWTASGKLQELTLQTEPRPDTDYNAELAPSWKEFIELLSTLYGKPKQKGPIPPANALKDGMFMPSHLWLLDGGGSALLGTAQEGSKYQLVVRFTDKKVGIVEIP